MIVPILFFCSGATALVYEIVWSKYLTQMFGSTVQAQTVVLAVFMGGLALGNRLFGRRSDTAAQPLALYGSIEIAIGLYAFFFPGIFRATDGLFVRLGTGHLDHGWLLLLLKGGLSVALLLGPTILMGGTLPLLAAWLKRQSPDAGRWSARFYSINSLGAVAGAFLAGFVLVRSLGMVSTLQMTGLVNVLIGFTAVGFARMQSGSTPTSDTAKATASPPDPEAQRLFRTGCLLVALTGGISMGLEVLASRSLALIFGASLQAFAIVLMSFILGIGVGSAVIASPRIRRLRDATTAAVLLLLAACWIGVLILAIEQWVEVYRELRTGLARTTMGYRFNQLIAGLLSLVVLGVPAAVIGAVLPLWIRTIGDRSNALGDQVGRLLTWNTLGAVVGTLVTGFVLMPKIGLRGSFGLLAALLAVTALCVAWSKHQPRVLFAAIGATGLIGLVCAVGGAGWRHVLSSGVFRARESEVDPRVLEVRKQHMKILFYEDAADATVSVEQGDGDAVTDETGLRINGKPEASNRSDLATQYLLAHLPLLARPESRDVFVLGLGSGITAGALLGHPVEQVVVAENCEPVLRAAQFFARWNRGVLTNSRVRFRIEDGRTVLKLSPQRYDVIISEPSNPWMIGVGSVFSREFYQLCASRLKDGGIMCQWFHVYEMSDDIVALVLRTFGRVFPQLEIWDVKEGDIILLGSMEPWASSPEEYRKVFGREWPRQDLETIGLKAPESIWTRQLASRRTAFAIAGDGAVQSDAFPILEYEAPRAFFIGAFARSLMLYDERTWQHELAPAAKTTVLSALDKELVAAAFREYQSANPDLNRYLQWRLSSPENRAGTNLQSAGQQMPCVFWPLDPASSSAVIPDQASEVLKQLLEAEHLVRSDRERWQKGVDTIGSVLRDYKPPSDKRSLSWSPSYFAMVAARISLSRGDWARAREVVAAGLKLEPNAHELIYLARILEREQPTR